MAKEKKTLEEKMEEAIVKDVPYEVSGNWVWTKLGIISEIKTGRKDANHGTDDGIYPFYTCASEPIKSPTYSFDGEYIILPGNGANVGMALYHKGKFEAYQRTYVLNSKAINNKYILYNLQYRWKDYNEDKQFGSATNYIKLGNITEFEIAIPPLKEQQRIIDRIESIFEKIDKAKELIEEAREGFGKRKAAVLEKAFRGGLTEKWREKNNICFEWKSSKLKNIARITSGGTPSRKREDYFEGDIPWIKTGEINWNEIYDSEEHITQEAVDNSSAKLIPEGTVLVAMYGQGLTRGRAAILSREACTNQAVCALIPTKGTLAKFLYYYFMKNYWIFRQLAKGGNQENLSGKVIGEFEIEIPTIKEQEEIIKILDKFLEEESKIEELTQLEEQIELIKKSILAKAFRGELGTNCEEDESALELLNDILKK